MNHVRLTLLVICSAVFLACGSTRAGSKFVEARKTPTCELDSANALQLKKEAANALASMPAPNADADAERDPVLAAMRSHLSNSRGEPARVELTALRVENGWAWLEVRRTSGYGAGERQAALLQKQDARWEVIETIARGGELERLGLANAAAYVSDLRSRHPQAPPSVFPAL